VRTREVRSAAWFERFAWFVSSENCLVLSARDGQQSDLLLKRHMRCELVSIWCRRLRIVLAVTVFTSVQQRVCLGIHAPHWIGRAGRAECFTMPSS
jgi:hypothetical protein